MRAKAVRDALAHMFRDAGQRAAAGTSLSAQLVLQQAAGRIDADFRDAPDASAQVLHALGELHLYINDYADAAPLLRLWLSRQTVIGDSDATADVQFALAEAVFRMGQIEEAVQLLHAAQAYWQADSARHVERLLTSRMLQSQLERQRGDLALSIETLEASLAQRLQRSGERHFETADLYSNLGAAYIQAGNLAQGVEFSTRALELWRLLKLDSGNDALNTHNNLAAAYFRSEQLDQAALHFKQALAIRRELYGPSAATAALLGNYARVLQRRGQYPAALALVDEAQPMATTHAGPNGLLALSLGVTRAELLIADGQLQAAEPVLVELESVADAPAQILLRVSLARATQLRDSGQPDEARRRLAEVFAMAERIAEPAQALRVEIDALAGSLQ